jgi:transmembrane sensor
LGGATWYWYETNLGNLYTTGIGEQHRITLPDGSIVELNAQSQVRVRYAEHLRDVDLISGEALFHVTHNPARPFTVHTDRTNIRAIGTQFDVYRKATGTIVTVLEGTVAVEDGTRPDNGSGVAPPTSEPDAGERSSSSSMRASAIPRSLLTAGDQAIISGQAAVKQAEPNVQAATAWTQGHLVFHATPLEEVASEFNRYNPRQLVIRDPELASFKVTGIFSSTDPSSLILFLEARPGIVVTETDHDILVSRTAQSPPVH